jgi:hypothetical protein
MVSRALASIIAGVLAAVYLALTTVYLCPSTPATQHSKGAVDAFMATYFPQGWQLFAPHPGYTSVKLVMRCKGKQWSGWFDPVEPLVQRHYRNRFGTAGLLMKQYKFIATDFYRLVKHYSTDCPNADGLCANAKIQILHSQQYQIAERFTSDVCAEREGVELLAFQFRILEVFPQPYLHRDETETFSRIISVDFPPVDRTAVGAY